MLRQKQEQKEAESEIMRLRRKWGQHRTAEDKTVANEKETENTVVMPSAQEEGNAQMATDELSVRARALREALQRRKSALRTAKAGTGISVSGLLIFVWLTARLPALTAPPGIWLILIGDVLGLASFFHGETALRAAVNIMAGTDDIRAAGPLAEALTQGEPSYSLAVSALSRLLPRLQSSDSALFNAAQRACLRRAFKQSSSRHIFWRYNPHFAAILRHALTIIGELPASEMIMPTTPEQRADNVERLLAQFQQAVEQRQKNAITICIGAISSAVFALLNAFLPLLTHGPSSYPLLWLAIASLTVTLTLSLRGQFRLKSMMNELAEAGDLRIIGPLIDIVPIMDSGSTNAMAALLLTRLLPQLKSSDATLLTDAQRANLGRALARNLTNADFLVAALKALEQIGDGSALPVVESLASGKLKSVAPQRVRQAAQECLPFLQTRSDQQRASQTLLRASGLSETAIDTLLRPAQGVVTTLDTELLRPGTPRPEMGSEEGNHDEQSGGFANPLAPFGALCGFSAGAIS